MRRSRPRRRVLKAVLAVAMITLAATGAGAHISPSEDDNNRFIKVTPAADRVRVAYTVLFGEKPGAQLRRSIDADRDGQISDDEAQGFGVKVAGEVAPAVEVEADGQARPITWTTIAVGMGTPTTAGGSFSVDLVTWICLTTARGPHRLRLRDRFRVPRPGELELKIEDSPGIQIDHARVGDARPQDGELRFAGPGGPLADHGLDLAFTVSEGAPRTADGTCAPAAAATGRPSRVLIIGAAALVGFVLAALVFLVQRRRRARRPAASASP